MRDCVKLLFLGGDAAKAGSIISSCQFYCISLWTNGFFALTGIAIACRYVSKIHLKLFTQPPVSGSSAEHQASVLDSTF